MRLRLTPSIANRIFAITAILIALMGVVAAVNAVMSLRVGALIGAVYDSYVPAYGMLARAHIRSLEQSVLMRQAVLERFGEQDETRITTLVAGSEQAALKAEAELTSARELLAKEATKHLGFDDAAQLGRIDAQLESIIRDRTASGKLRQELGTALHGNDREAIDALLAKLDEIRDGLNDRAEKVRAETFGTALHALATTMGNQREVIVLTLVSLGIAVLLGVLLSMRLTRRIVEAMRALVSATEAVEQGRYEGELPVTSRDEIGRLARAFNLMVAELRTRERIRETFGKYVDPKVVEGLIERPELTGSAGDRRVMTVFFADMKGFSHLSEEITAPALVRVLNRYFTIASEAIRGRQGIVDKFIGDAVMGFWGPPFVPGEMHALLACEAAAELAARFPAFQAEIPDLLGFKRFTPDIGLRIGIATGEVIVGSVGSEVARNFTVMGDSVNVASRLEGLNKLYGTRILASEGTAALVGDAIALREVDRVVVAGRQGPVTVFEVQPAADPDALARYAEGLSAYRRREWDAADAGFSACLALAPADGPARAMLARLPDLRRFPPPPDWDGVWIVSGK
jgi:class 3 adenylate cyclase